GSRPGDCEHIRIKPQSGGMWLVHQQAACCLMNVRTNTGKSCRNKELLRVPVKSVVCLSRQPAIESVAVSHQETAGVGGALPDRMSGGIFCVESCSLNADLRPLLLRKCSRYQQCN